MKESANNKIEGASHQRKGAMKRQEKRAGERIAGKIQKKVGPLES